MVEHLKLVRAPFSIHTLTAISHSLFLICSLSALIQSVMFAIATFDDVPTTGYDQLSNLRRQADKVPRASLPSHPPALYTPFGPHNSLHRKTSSIGAKTATGAYPPSHSSPPLSKANPLSGRIDWSDVQKTRVAICNAYNSGSETVKSGMLRDVLIVLLHSITPRKRAER